MPTPLYKEILASLKRASVPMVKAKRAMARLMKHADVQDDGFDEAFAASIRLNLEGTVVLIGDRTQLASFREELNDLLV